MMWNKRFDRAMFNGHELNILSVSFDGGQRVQVNAIPYADLPIIKTMGASAETISVEVVYVGVNSLADANNLIATLQASPRGELEHKYIGEIPVHFQTYSQTVSTQKGLVTLSLNFVRTAKRVQQTTSLAKESSVSLSSAIANVDTVSSELFIADVDSLELEQITNTRDQLSLVLESVDDTNSRLKHAAEMAETINSHINTAKTALEHFSSDPAYFTRSLTELISSVSGQVILEPETLNLIDTSSAAQKQFLKVSNGIQGVVQNPSAINFVPIYIKIQCVLAAIQSSKDLNKLNEYEQFDLLSSTRQPDLLLSYISNIITAMNEIVDIVTLSSSVESVSLYQVLQTLKEVIQAQRNKILFAIKPDLIHEADRYTPFLSLAHDSSTSHEMITRLNAVQHPIFCKGNIALKGG